jgi:hypothetical protein
MKGYTKETDKQLKELRKIAEERSDISFHTHVDVQDSIVEEVVEKAAEKLNQRIELGEKETKEVLLGDDLVNKIASSSANQVTESFKGKVYSEEDFRPEIVREVISIMLEREKKKLKKAETESKEREEDLIKNFEERFSSFRQEVLEEISNIHIDAPPPEAKVEITGSTLLPELSRLIGMQQDSYLEKLKDYIKNDVTEALDKKLHELNVVPEPKPDLHTLKELRKIHGKFPFDVIDYTDEEKTKFQIRKFEGEEAYCSVYLTEGKKVKVDDTFNINEKKYIELTE